MGVLALCLLLPLATAESAPAIREQRVAEPVFGGEVFFLEAGAKNSPTVLLVHGLGDLASGTWEKVIPDLARDYRVVAVDLPGFGRSSKQNALYSPANYARFLDWFAEKYTAGPLIVVGHSLGGAVTLRYAALQPARLQKIVVVDAAGILHRNVISKTLLDFSLREQFEFLPAGPLRGFDSWFDGLFAHMPELPVDLDQILGSGLLRGRFLAGDPGRIAALALVQEDFSPLLGRIETPTAIVWGAEDAVTPLRTGVVLETVLPRAHLQVIPGAGHLPMFDQPLLFAQALRHALVQPVPPAPTPPSAVETGVCRRQSGLTFTGAYERLEITDCSDVRLVDFSARAVTITRSRVSMESGEIRGPGTALQIAGSTVSASGLQVEGETALAVSRSRLDLAGVSLTGREAALSVAQPTAILFSVSRAQSPRFRGFLHGPLMITPQEGL